VTVLPIVGRELRVAARRSGTFWLRTLTAAGVIAASLVILLLTRGESPREAGQVLFAVLTGGLLVYCLFVGVRLTADCLSEEKREGTLGLLFLTDLKGYDVVLGKLAATSIPAVYSLLATFPVLALPLLLGAVAPGEIARAALVLANTMLLSLCAGLFVSAVSYHARKAANGTVLLLLLCAAGAPALGAWLAHVFEQPNPPEAFLVVSPAYALAHAYASAYRVNPAKFWTSMAVIHLLAWWFLALASAATRRAWQDRPAGRMRLRWLTLWQHWSCGDAAERLAFRRRLLGINAYFWRVARDRWKPLAVWTLLACIALAWVIAALKYGKDFLVQPVYLTTAYLTAAVLKLWIASEASQTLAVDRHSGALELLLSTPLTAQDIVRGQLLALRRQFLGPILAVLGVAALGFFLAAGDDTLDLGGAQLLTLWLAGAFVLVADAGALAVLGMWLGATAKSALQASSGTIWRILVLPWVAYLVALTALGTGMAGHEPDWWILLGLWLVLGLVADAGFGVWSWHNLQTRLRYAATARFPAPRSWWLRLRYGDTLSR